MAVTPFQHPCDESTIDYSLADQGKLWCTVCGKQWTLGYKGWEPRPLVKYKPKERS